MDVDTPFEETCDRGAWPFSYTFRTRADIDAGNANFWYDTNDNLVSETDVDDFDHDDKTNTDLVLGCDKDCRAYDSSSDSSFSGSYNIKFKCPLQWDVYDS